MSFSIFKMANMHLSIVIGIFANSLVIAEMIDLTLVIGINLWQTIYSFVKLVIKLQKLSPQNIHFMFQFFIYTDCRVMQHLNISIIYTRYIFILLNIKCVGLVQYCLQRSCIFCKLIENGFILFEKEKILTALFLLNYFGSQFREIRVNIIEHYEG